jgi:hypothetical protein
MISLVQKRARVEDLIPVRKLLHGPWTVAADRIATGDESWLRYVDQISNMASASHRDLIPRTSRMNAQKETLVPLSLTSRKLMVLESLETLGNSGRIVSCRRFLQTYALKQGHITGGNRGAILSFAWTIPDGPTGKR